jgi:hypothetical protein
MVVNGVILVNRLILYSNIKGVHNNVNKDIWIISIRVSIVLAGHKIKFENYFKNIGNMVVNGLELVEIFKQAGIYI